MAVHAVLVPRPLLSSIGGRSEARVRRCSKFKHLSKCLFSLLRKLRASGPGYRGTGGSEEFQEWASDHVSPWIDGRMKSDEIWKLWVFDFRVARYTTVIKTTPFFDRTKNYIYNGVLTSFLVTKASLSSRISGLERWPHGLMNLNLSEVCAFCASSFCIVWIMFSCHRLFYASMRCDVANFRAAWQWFCPLWLCYLERKELRPAAGISLKHAKRQFTHFTWTFSWNRDRIHRVFRTFVCFPASISSQVPCRAGACWAAGKRGDARSITKSLFVDASDFRIHHVDTRVQCVQRIFIPHFWSQWVLRRVWILMSRPKHRVQKREDFSDNQESKQWSYWSTRYQAERRFWKILWTHSSSFITCSSCLHISGSLFMSFHLLTGCSWHFKYISWQKITIHHHSSIHPRFIWSGSRRHQVCGLPRLFLLRVDPLSTIANLLVLSKFYIHYIHWIWLLNCSIWSYHDFFRTTSRLFFSEGFVLCDSNGEEHR